MVARTTPPGALRKLVCATAVVCALVAITTAVPIAPSKDWCKVSSTQKEYGIYPSGKCAKCSFGVSDGNHCDEVLGQVCNQGPTYALITKGQYRRCVCGKGWYGSPIGDKQPADVEFGGSDTAGCARCSIFGTTSKVGSTSWQQCNICRKDLLFTGTGPFCQWNPTAFTLPNCTFPVGNYWSTNAVKIKGKCACKAGYVGNWPDCRQCATGLTAPAGNGKTCGCDPKQGYVQKPKAKPGVCNCNNAAGYYPPVPGRKTPTCVQCKKLEGTIVVTYKNGVKRCGCDTKKGYGINLGVGGPQCIKCSNHGAVVKGGVCRCQQAGYGIEAGFNGENYPSPNYCVPCNMAGHQVNGKGICSCTSGYARTNYVPDRNCIPCAGDNKRPVNRPADYPQPVCGCAPGYDGLILNPSDKCSKCPAGQVSAPVTGYCSCKDKNAGAFGSGCPCNEGYIYSKKTKRCELGAECKASRWRVRYWDAKAIGASWNGSFFPSHLLDKKVKPTKTFTLASLNADLPGSKLALTGRFTVVLDAVVLGKKAAPFWLGAGSKRFIPVARLTATTTRSRVDSGTDANFLTSTYPSNNGGFSPWGFTTRGSLASWGNTCTRVRIGWWGTQAGATLKARILRDISPSYGAYVFGS